jgi:hypothetical protein
LLSPITAHRAGVAAQVTGAAGTVLHAASIKALKYATKRKVKTAEHHLHISVPQGCLQCGKHIGTNAGMGAANDMAI